MPLTNPFRSLSSAQFHAFLASLAGWALDAFDFFLLVFAVRSIAKDFHTDVHAVSQCIFWTLAMRPVGALLFGWLAERYGRRPILMVNVVSYSVCELASAAAPDLRTLIVTRALFGLAMGGEWGVGAALSLERPRPGAAASSRACCRRATSSGTCWRRWSSPSCSIASAGAACSCSARRPRCWSCTYGARSRSLRPGSRATGARRGPASSNCARRRWPPRSGPSRRTGRGCCSSCSSWRA